MDRMQRKSIFTSLLPMGAVSMILICGCILRQAEEGVFISSQKFSERYGEQSREPDLKSRKIHTGDLVILRVIPGKEFEKELESTINLDGEILVPLIGWVDVEDITTAEAAEKIRELLDQDYIVNPRVSLRIKEAKARAVVLLGQLKKPGTYQFPPDGRMTLLESVAKAEGFTDIASLTKIKVVRDGPDGKPFIIRVNADRILEGKEPDLDLQEGDLITVPETLF